MNWKVVTLVLASLAATQVAQAAQVQWNYNNRAVAAGTACRSSGDAADTFFINAGEEFSIVFSRMGVNLGSEWSPLAERHNCTVRVPVRIPKGMYIGELNETVIYGVTKSAGSSGEIGLRSTFFNLPAAAKTKSFRYGAFIDDAMSQLTNTTNYAVQAPSWCARPGIDGMYALNLAIAGQRDNPYENLVMQIDGADIKFTVKAGWYYCNL